ncbi:Fic family protein [Legionella hackeliae]|uniref:Fido domain-containing protein n=1 Tax=Legionella hackeliae TaxID=449 RepID=A0A0A8UTZ0_LEGHA|nr:Fic family protein [Legionella hackeliae]KTD11209.1 Fic/DOC family protein [Legionella hackeliae]CEK10996.1 protein of unknown function [Legionella hackeliae]STX47735.1 Fic/DOC family [Legionella hackeliae]
MFNKLLKSEFSSVTSKFTSITHNALTMERLYESISDLTSRLSQKDMIESNDYRSLCIQLNYLFLNIQRDNQTFILEKKGQQAVRNLLDELNQREMKIPERYEAKEDHTFFYFHLLKSWLNFATGNFSEAIKLLEIARTFPQKTKALETDHLLSVADEQMEQQKSTEQCLMQENKQTTGETALSSPEFTTLVSKYSSNKKQQLLDISDETLARYFIDPRHQKEKGDPIAAWNKREPGSVSAMVKMIRAMFNKDADLSVDFIKEMHKLALEGVTLPQAGRKLPITPGEFRKESVRFSMKVKYECSLAGYYNLSDWVEKQKIKKRHFVLITSDSFNSIELQIHTAFSQIEEQLLELINDYRANISSATSVREVIKACATFSHDFVLMHPFSDGNLRLSQQLLNFLLAKNNLPLCILSEPFLIPGVSPDELVDHIAKGFDNFEHLMTKGYLPGTNIEFDSENIDKNDNPTNLIGQSIFKSKAGPMEDNGALSGIVKLSCELH